MSKRCLVNTAFGNLLLDVLVLLLDGTVMRLDVCYQQLSTPTEVSRIINRK
jgi:hypothetical protein